jgi:hypothetical protein
MTILPAGDGDVPDNDGAKFYDQARPEPFKSQLYVYYANHNFFNREWLNNDGMGPPVMSRHDHERTLLVYGCAFFRGTLLGHGTVRLLSGQMVPSGVAAENVHLSFEWQDAFTVDNHEDGNGIERNSLNMPTDQYGGMDADEYPFRREASAFNWTFFGNSLGMVAQDEDVNGCFRSPLQTPTDLVGSEIWIRAAEVFNSSILPDGATGFELGLEDYNGVTVWVDSDRVGGLPRPYPRSFAPKTMLKTLRFRASCFEAANPAFDIGSVAAILIRTNRGDQRPLAFDDLQIVRHT